MKRRSLTQSQSSKKNHYLFDIGDSNHLIISSNFESGNIRLVRQKSPLSVLDDIIEYLLESVSDVQGSIGKKSWFFFKMKCTEAFKVKVEIKNVNIYQTNANKNQQCQPLFRVGCKGSWSPVANAYFSNEEDPRLIFDFKLPKSEEIFFCISIPFTYTDNQIYLSQLQSKILPQIFYRNQLLVTTLENRDIRLITISEYSSHNIEHQIKNKPVVLITSRVHPGEVTSSFLLMGMIEMLIDNSLESYLLRRLFQWKIVPMLNPDGVAAGNYRMDPQGCNLNRQYLEPDQVLHPASFKIIELMNQLSSTSRKIQFYFDLHSHSSMKDGFIYGNALDDLVQQSYSQLFCKILEENNLWFKYSQCEFGQKHMRHKDKGQQKTKQGCGRVMALKIGQVIRSYTLETSMLPGYYYKFQKGILKQRKNIDFQYLPPGYSQSLRIESITKDECKTNPMIAITKRLGRDVLLSMLDMLEKNPYSRMSNGYNRFILRDIAQKLLQREERFKLLDSHTYAKPKIAYKIVEEQMQSSVNEAWRNAGIFSDLKKMKWPQQFKINTLANLTSKYRIKFQNFRCQSEQRGQIQTKKETTANKLTTRQQLRQQLYMSLDNSNMINNNKPMDKFKMNKDNRPQTKYLIKSSEKADVKNLKIFYHIPNNILSDSIIDHQANKKSPNKSLINKQIIHSITPSMLLRNSAKSIAKERTEKKKASIKNYYQVSIQQRKRALTQLRSPSQQYPQIFPPKQHFSIFPEEFSHEDRNTQMNQQRNNKRTDYPDQKSSKEKSREFVRLPSMKANIKSIHQGFHLRKGIK